MGDTFDKEALMERVDGDEELAKELLELYLEDVPDRINAIKQAQTSGDMKTITIEAHTIKGSSSNIGADDIKEAAFQVELAGKDENQETIPSLIQQLEEKFNTFQQFLSQMD